MSTLPRAAPLWSRFTFRSVSPMLTRSVSDSQVQDVVTHTGQKWESNDYRLARFMNSPKIVNPNWAIDLIAQVPVIKVPHNKVWCDGGGGPEGHPRVFINLDKPGANACGYCGLQYTQEQKH